MINVSWIIWQRCAKKRRHVEGILHHFGCLGCDSRYFVWSFAWWVRQVARRSRSQVASVPEAWLARHRCRRRRPRARWRSSWAPPCLWYCPKCAYHRWHSHSSPPLATFNARAPSLDCRRHQPYAFTVHGDWIAMLDFRSWFSNDSAVPRKHPKGGGKRSHSPGEIRDISLALVRFRVVLSLSHARAIFLPLRLAFFSLTRCEQTSRCSYGYRPDTYPFHLLQCSILWQLFFAIFSVYIVLLSDWSEFSSKKDRILFK